MKNEVKLTHFVIIKYLIYKIVAEYSLTEKEDGTLVNEDGKVVGFFIEGAEDHELYEQVRESIGVLDFDTNENFARFVEEIKRNSIDSFKNVYIRDSFGLLREVVNIISHYEKLYAIRNRLIEVFRFKDYGAQNWIFYCDNRQTIINNFITATLTARDNVVKPLNDAEEALNKFLGKRES